MIPSLGSLCDPGDDDSDCKVPFIVSVYDYGIYDLGMIHLGDDHRRRKGPQSFIYIVTRPLPPAIQKPLYLIDSYWTLLEYL